MPEPEAQNWLTVAASLVGGVIFWLVVAFRKYWEGRAEEADNRADIPANAVGAAFVDRAAADAIVGIAGHMENVAQDIKAIRTVADGMTVRAAEEHVLAQARRAAREEFERAERTRHGRRDD